MKPLASVLLVEDDSLVRDVLATALEAVTDDLTVASDGPGALAALERRSFSAVITDLRIPEPDGLVIVAETHRLQPAARLVMISGYADEAASRAIRQRGGVLVHKPFGARELFAALGCARPW